MQHGEEITAEDRRLKITELLHRHGKVKVSALSEMFKVSETSIRNDLSELEKNGFLKRTYGGALSTARVKQDLSFQERFQRNVEEKKRIAKAAANMIEDGNSIILDSGTTTVHLAREIINKRNLIVVTNAIPIVLELGSYPDINLIILGGTYRSTYQSTGGQAAIEQLSKYKLDKLFLAADGVSVEDGITTYQIDEAEICRIMIERAKEVIVVADSSKLVNVSFAKIAPISVVDIIITDDKADKDEVKALREAGVEVILV